MQVHGSNCKHWFRASFFESLVEGAGKGCRLGMCPLKALVYDILLRVHGGRCRKMMPALSVSTDQTASTGLRHTSFFESLVEGAGKGCRLSTALISWLFATPSADFTNSVLRFNLVHASFLPASFLLRQELKIMGAVLRPVPHRLASLTGYSAARGVKFIDRCRQLEIPFPPPDLSSTERRV